MKLRVIRAARMSDAMAQLRAEMGEDAVLLSTRRVAGGVEVTAAQDQDDEPLMIAPDGARAHRAIPADLARHNVPAELAHRLAAGRLSAALDAVLGFAPLPIGDTPLLLAGPPGGGKTLTVAKLATRLVLAGARPLLVSADGRRAGAAEQLAAFARVLDLPLAVASGPAALTKALARRAMGQTVLVDLPGCDPFNPAGARGLAALIDAATQGALGAALKRGDMTGKRGSTLLLHGLPGIQAERVLLVGFGKADEFNDKAYAEALRAALKAVASWSRSPGAAASSTASR